MELTLNTRKYLGFNDTWWMIIGIPLLGFSIPLVFFGERLDDGLIGYLPKWGIATLHTAAFWVSIRLIILSLRKMYPSQKEIGKRLLYTSVLVLFAFFAIERGLEFVNSVCFPAGAHEIPSEFEIRVASLMIIALVSSIYEGIYLNARWKASLIEKELLKRENIESQLEGLRSQVNPHFLFNSLNTLAYIIPQDPDRAVKFVQQLSKVYRYILEIRDKKLISVREELKFLDSYIFLIKERFGENLQVNISVSKSIYEENILPLSMQMLFENAIKHNIISSSKPLTIEVFLQNEKICVRNNLQKKKQSIPSTKVGLQNIRNRYAFFTDQRVEVNEDEHTFSVGLPLLHSPKGAVLT
jgi:two-component system LytT family sensor kinase